MRYFELFGLPVTYQVDITQLNQRYLELQRVVHPDRYAGKSEREQLLAVQKTAEINDALLVLKDPIARAEYMLKARGVDLQSEQTTLKDPEFLMQQMMLREALEDLPQSDNIDVAIGEFESQIDSLEQQYSSSLPEQLDEKASDQSRIDAADNIRKLKFIAKLRDELARIEDNLFD